MSIVIRLLSLISHTTIVTAVIILLLHRLIVAVDCRDHLVQYVLLTLGTAFELAGLVVPHQVRPAVGRRSTGRFVVLHNSQILLDCLRRVLDVYKVFEKPLIIF